MESKFSKLTFGQVIRSARMRLGIQGKELATRLDRSLSPTYITKMEQHGSIPSPRTITSLSLILGLDLKFLLDLAKQEKVAKYKKLLDARYKRELDV